MNFAILKGHLTPWGRKTSYEKVEDTGQKIWIKPLQKIDMGVAGALFDH